MDFGELPGTDMGIDFGCFGTGMAQQFLDVAKVYSLLQEVGGKTMAQGMRCGVFLDVGLSEGFAEYVLDARGTVLSTSLSLKEPVFGFVQFVIVS